VGFAGKMVRVRNEFFEIGMRMPNPKVEGRNPKEIRNSNPSGLEGRKERKKGFLTRFNTDLPMINNN
jgi:hypothetical protein